VDKTRKQSVAAMISKLGRLGTLDPEDVAAIEGLPWRERTARGGSYLIRQGMPVSECSLLVSGFSARSKITDTGRRQIVSFQIPGDMLDLQHLVLGYSDHSVEVITDAVLLWVDADALREVAFQRPGVGQALWRDAFVDASISREWLLNVGQRPGRARIAHLLCEFAYRCVKAELASSELFELPLTQEQIADATGMTAIHVNRMISTLRVAGVISSRKRRVEIRDWAQIQVIAGFNPDYLHDQLTS
jgi:CRP-like cAMP-binding protein